MSRPIDVMHLGNDRVICAYEVDGLIIDPGPTSSVDTLIDALGPVVPRALLLTHIHLDHAGASGVLARRFPDLEVYVHERGARHLADPSKLLESAARLYGDDMERLWGEVAAVPEDRIHTLSGGETIHGFRVAYTPGHASHHVAYLHEDSGDAYTGDVTGVRVPPHDHTVAPTPPPDIDVDAWLDSLHTVAAWTPERLCLTHFGPVTEVEDHLHRIRTALLDSAEVVRDSTEPTFVDWLRARARAAVDAESADRLEQAAPPDQLFKGLERYWRKKAEAVGEPAGAGPERADSALEERADRA